MKTRAMELLKALEVDPDFYGSIWLPTIEAHLAAAYEQGRADERIAQNPPGVAQPWETGLTALLKLLKEFEKDFPDFPEEEPDPSVKSLNPGEVAQLGSALARTRAR